MSVCRKRRRTALPNEPVPPDMSNLLPLNIITLVSSFFDGPGDFFFGRRHGEA